MNYSGVQNVSEWILIFTHAICFHNNLKKKLNNINLFQIFLGI